MRSHPRKIIRSLSGKSPSRRLKRIRPEIFRIILLRGYVFPRFGWAVELLSSASVFVEGDIAAKDTGQVGIVICEVLAFVCSYERIFAGRVANVAFTCGLRFVLSRFCGFCLSLLLYEFFKAKWHNALLSSWLRSLS
jgi:hypothetical protein